MVDLFSKHVSVGKGFDLRSIGVFELPNGNFVIQGVRNEDGSADLRGQTFVVKPDSMLVLKKIINSIPLKDGDKDESSSE